MKKRNLFKKSKPKKRKIKIETSRRKIVIPKPKKRKLPDIDDQWWIDKILMALKTDIKKGGGYLFDHGLFIFTKLKTIKVPKHIIKKMVNKRLIKKVQKSKNHFSYTLIIRRRKL